MGEIEKSTILLNDINSKIVKESKKAADQYEWLYHCTSVDALLSIISNREMWLSNLQVVNDQEEAKRISSKTFEKSYYVACFTYDKNILNTHWEEYGKSNECILFGLKKTWFEKKLTFLEEEHKKCNEQCFSIYNSFNDALNFQKNEIKKGKSVGSPYFVIDYGFYKIIYDDNLKAKMETEAVWKIDGNNVDGTLIIPSVAGIIKSTHGICYRDGKEPYEKDWTSEKEVRLKVGVTTNNAQITSQGYYFRQMAIRLSKDAFSELPIKFGMNMSCENRKRSILKIESLLPETEIYEI